MVTMRLSCNLVLLFVVFLAIIFTVSGCEPSSDRLQAERKAMEFLNFIKEGQFDPAYRMMDQDRRLRISKDLFINHLKEMGMPENLGSFYLLNTVVSKDRARASFIVQSEQGEDFNYIVPLVKKGQEWLVSFDGPLLWKVEDNRPRVVFAHKPEQLQQFFHENTPGLKRAEELGLVTDLGITRNVPGTDMNLRLERIWYSREKVYLFYSLGVPLSIIVPGREIEISGNLHLPGGIPSNENFYPKLHPGEGAVYEGRFYSCMVFNPVYDISYNRPLEKVEQLQLDLKVRLGRASKFLEPVVSSIDYNTSKEIIKRFNAAGDFNIPGCDLALEQLVAGTSKNFMYFRFFHPEEDWLLGLEGIVKTDKGEERRFYLSEPDGPGRYRVDFEPFDRMPERIEVSLERVKLVGKDQLAFELDVEKYHLPPEDATMYEDAVDRPLGKIKNTQVILEQVFCDDRGIHLSLDYKVEGSPPKPYVKLLAEMLNPMEFYQQGGRWFQQAQRPSPINALDVVNEKGEPAVFGGLGHGPGDSVGFSLAKSFIDRSRNITVRIGNLTYEIVGEKWKADLELLGDGETVGQKPFNQVGFSELPPDIQRTAQDFMREKTAPIMVIATNTEKGYLVVAPSIHLEKVELDESAKVHIFLTNNGSESTTESYKCYEIFVRTGFSDVVNHMVLVD